VLEVEYRPDGTPIIKTAIGGPVPKRARNGVSDTSSTGTSSPGLAPTTPRNSRRGASVAARREQGDLSTPAGLPSGCHSSGGGLASLSLGLGLGKGSGAGPTMRSLQLVLLLSCFMAAIAAVAGMASAVPHALFSGQQDPAWQ